MGFVAAEIVRHGGMVICAAVSPYRATRNEVRNMVGAEQYIEVFVDAPLEVCEAAGRPRVSTPAHGPGELKNFTGIDDPYEAPRNPEVHLDTSTSPPEENAQPIIDLLLERGFIRPNAG